MTQEQRRLAICLISLMVGIIVLSAYMAKTIEPNKAQRLNESIHKTINQLHEKDIIYPSN